MGKIGSDGQAKLVRIIDEDGDPVRVSNVADGVYRLAVDAIIGGGGGATVGSQVLANVQEVAVLATADIFPAAAVAPRDGVILVEFITDTDANLSLDLVRAATSRSGALNDASVIKADRWQSFTFPVKAADAVNLHINVGAVVTAMISFQDKT